MAYRRTRTDDRSTGARALTGRHSHELQVSCSLAGHFDGGDARPVASLAACWPLSGGETTAPRPRGERFSIGCPGKAEKSRISRDKGPRRAYSAFRRRVRRLPGAEGRWRRRNSEPRSTGPIWPERRNDRVARSPAGSGKTGNGVGTIETCSGSDTRFLTEPDERRGLRPRRQGLVTPCHRRGSDNNIRKAAVASRRRRRLKRMSSNTAGNKELQFTLERTAGECAS